MHDVMHCQLIKGTLSNSVDHASSVWQVLGIIVKAVVIGCIGGNLDNSRLSMILYIVRWWYCTGHILPKGWLMTAVCLQVLGIVVKAVVTNLEDAKGQPAGRLHSKLLELFGRITSKVCWRVCSLWVMYTVSWYGYSLFSVGIVHSQLVWL